MSYFVRQDMSSLLSTLVYKTEKATNFVKFMPNINIKPDFIHRVVL